MKIIVTNLEEARRMLKKVNMIVNMSRLMKTPVIVPRVRGDDDEVFENEESDYEDEDESDAIEKKKTKKMKIRRAMVDGLLFKDNSLSKGGTMKAANILLLVHEEKTGRQSNVICKVEAFGRICQRFDERRRKWVMDMGFGGLLNLAKMHLPRQLSYWLMTRIDPINELFISPEGIEYRLSKNQIKWVLGIPNGGRAVPLKNLNDEMESTSSAIMDRYGKEWVDSVRGKKLLSKGIHVNVKLMDRVEGQWKEHEEEFKTLFLLFALDMVLCPTQSPRLAADLVPSITCAMDAMRYDWCALVLKKLMFSLRSFASRFYEDGFAGGCGGCSIFVVLFYLDRLDGNPVQWGEFPRLKVWTMDEIA